MYISQGIKTNKGFFPNYFISQDGDIFNSKGKLLSWKMNENGYANICLRRDNKNYYFKIHRLVAMNFLNNDNLELDVNHKNGKKFKNNVKNLEWVTRSINLKHAYSTGLKDSMVLSKKGETNNNNKHSEKMIRTVIRDIFFRNKTNKEIHERTKIPISTIKAIRHKRLWKSLIETMLK